MHWYNVSEFVEEVERIRDFVAELASNGSDNNFFGTRKIRLLSSLDIKDVPITNFEIRLSDVLRFAVTVDKDLADRIRSVEADYKLSSRLMQIYSVINIAKAQSNSRAASSSTFWLNFILGILPHFLARLLERGDLVFSRSNIPIDEMLAGLERIIHLSREVYELGYQRIKDDDELFKPSSVNKEIILSYIDNAETVIRRSEYVAPAYRKIVLEHLLEARVEFSRSAPDFKKIIGALVIVATLLSGLAAAPEAIENVNKAISAILSNSIDRIPKNDHGKQLFHGEDPFTQEI